MKCEECSAPMTLTGRDRSGADYTCWECTRRVLRELREQQPKEQTAALERRG